MPSVTIIRCGQGFEPGKFYVMCKLRGSTPFEARVAGPYDTAREAEQGRLACRGAENYKVCREISSRTYKAQKAALTRAINSRDPIKVRAEVLRTVAEWDQTGMWPDGWHRWNMALYDATGCEIDEYC